MSRMIDRTVKIVSVKERSGEFVSVGHRYGYYVDIETDDGTYFRVSKETYKEMGKPTIDAKIHLTFEVRK